MDYVPAATGTAIVNKRNAMNSDIIDAIHSNYAIAVPQVKKLAPYFKGKSRKDTAFKIWHFLRSRAYYVRDGQNQQQIRLPARFINDTVKKFNSGDCKSFALFSASILGALGMPVYFKYTAYDKAKKHPSHVYVLTKDEHGNFIAVDGCYNKFNIEKKYHLSKLYPMDVVTLAGLKEAGKMNNRQKLRAFMQQLTPHERNRLQAKIERLAYVKGKALHGIEAAPKKSKPKKKAGQKVKDFFKKVGRAVATAALGVGRGAFLAVIALNFGGLASKMKLLEKKGKFKSIEEKWRDLGGFPKLLKKAINTGEKKKALFLSKKAKRKFDAKMKAAGMNGIDDCITADANTMCVIEGIGVIPVAAAVAAGAPVLAAIIPIVIKALKGIGGREAQQAAAETAATGQELVNNYNGAQGQQELEADAEESIPFDEAAGSESVEGINGDYDALFEGLSTLAGNGIKALGKVIDKKAQKSKNGAKVVKALATAGDDFFTGAYVRQSGVKDKVKKALKYGGDLTSGLQTWAPLALGAAALAYAVRGRK